MKHETKTVKVRVGLADYASWVAEARKANLTVSEWLRRRVSLRPTTARKRKYAEVLAEKEAQERAISAPDLPDDDLSPEELAEWEKHDPVIMGWEAERKAREAAWEARLESERLRSLESNRRWKANGLAYAAGGVERWFASMTPEQCEEWADLRDDMLRCERKQ
jgi:hypothetical protein